MAIEEQKSIERAVTRIQDSLKNKESVRLAFTNDFLFAVRAKRRYALPISIILLIPLIIPALALLGWPGSQFFGPILIWTAFIPLIAALVPLIPGQILGMVPIKQVYVITDRRLDIYTKRGKHLSSIWFNRVGTVFEAQARSGVLGNVCVFSFLERKIKEVRKPPKTNGIRDVIRSARSLDESFRSMNGTLNFFKRSILYVKSEMCNEIKQLIGSLILPDCKIFSYNTHKSN